MTPAVSQICVFTELELKLMHPHFQLVLFSLHKNSFIREAVEKIPFPTWSVLYPLILALLIIKHSGAVVENQGSSFSFFFSYSSLEKKEA